MIPTLFGRGTIGVLRTGVATIALLVPSAAALAQTTVTLNQSDTRVWSATIRGGSYANKNQKSLLETRSSSDPEYARRALLKFDTQNAIPEGTPITSATLTLTVKDGSADASRRIGVYQITTSWGEDEVTWKQRRTSTSWQTTGGDLGTKLTEKAVGNAAGTKVTFDVTPIVKQAVSGALGSSRYTRLALVDLDASTKESWRGYYTAYDSNAAVRPTLTVVLGSGASAPPSAPPSSPTGTGKILRILHYNIAKNGHGTDGKYDPNRIVAVVVKANPDIISFNELEKFNSYSAGLDGVAQYKSLIEAKTGVKWYVWDVQDYGDWDGKGLHSAVFSKYPISGTHRFVLETGTLKTVGGVLINVNGRNINFMTTHFDPYSTTERAVQANDLVPYMNGFAEDRIICGDFNDQSYNPPILKMTGSYYDAWAEGKKAGIATSAPDNPNGNTKNSRIDYIFYSKGEKHLTLKKVQVIDTRDSKGYMPSDHRPVLAEFLVQ